MASAFACHVVSPLGKRSTVRKEGTSAESARRDCEREGLVVLRVKLIERDGGSSGLSAMATKAADVLEFTRAMAALTEAGVPLARALLAVETMGSPRMNQLSRDLRLEVERGDTLQSALERRGGRFVGLYAGTIGAGEQSGDVAGAFRRLAAHLDASAAIQSRLLSAMLYPSLLALGGGVAVTVLLFVVLPRFAEMLGANGVELPRSTAMLFALADATRTHWRLSVGVALCIAALGCWVMLSVEGRRAAAGLFARLPVIRPLHEEVTGARVGRLLAVLMYGGAPVLGALASAEATVADPAVRERLAKVRSSVREGIALHVALATAGHFPPMLCQLVALGEATGKVPAFLDKAAAIVEERVERRLQRLVALAEPAMIIAFGGIVGFVALALLKAVYSVNAGSF